jgi:hypothetical protein
MITVTINGASLEVPDGTTVAAAVMRAGVTGFRPLCGMGICFECRITLNGRPTNEVAKPYASPAWRCAPMRSFDVLVVGAGPAGMAAAWATSSPSRRVGVIDDNPGAGGQIWRGERSSHWFTRFSTCGAELLNGKRVLARAGPQKLLTKPERSNSPNSSCVREPASAFFRFPAGRSLA